MPFLSPTLTVLRVTCLLSLGATVSGCAVFQRPPPNDVVPPAAQEPAAAAPAKAPEPTLAATSRAAPAKSDNVAPLTLSVFYLERIMLPDGSDLTVTITGTGLDTPVVTASKTAGGPPYAVEIDLPNGAAYPLTVAATITSGDSISFSGTETLNSAADGPVELRVSSAS